MSACFAIWVNGRADKAVRAPFLNPSCGVALTPWAWPSTPFLLKNTYTIKEAQRNIAGMVRTAERGNLATITRHQKPVAYVLSPQRLSELLETMEILTDPKAMRSIRDAEAGRGKVYDLKDLPE